MRKHVGVNKKVAGELTALEGDKENAAILDAGYTSILSLGHLFQL